MYVCMYAAITVMPRVGPTCDLPPFAGYFTAYMNDRQAQTPRTYLPTCSSQRVGVASVSTYRSRSWALPTSLPLTHRLADSAVREL